MPTVMVILLPSYSILEEERYELAPLVHFKISLGSNSATLEDGPAGSSVVFSRKVSCILDFSWAEAIF